VTIDKQHLLGAVIAGGQSRRFGSDKAVAMIDGLPLIDHVVMGLYRHCGAIVIAGRDWRDFDVVSDGDFIGQGPLAGLLGALEEASRRALIAVVTAPCDVLPIPDLTALQGETATTFAGQPLLGFWPVSLAGALRMHLSGQPERSMRGWIATCNARELPSATRLHNFNIPADIAAFEKADFCQS
jgi:molybdopterin-guanine dinucleotide biosynthesis protein A